ncbi:MAG: prenyltransferase [Planctomycetes bacterium]|nr:prenyltransferase [Planctomycetota bacterium]
MSGTSITSATVEAPVRRGGMAAGIWRLADPKITLASMSSIFLGTCLAARDGPIAWGWLALTVLGIFFIEAAKNASGEIFDYDSGADPGVAPEDRSPFSGGKRVLVDGLLTRRQTKVVAAVGFLLGIAIGLWIVAVREPRVLWVGFAGVALAYLYNGAPARLSYRGLGELAVGLAYGPFIAAGAYLVQRNSLSPRVVLASIPLGLMIAAFLWINEFPDYHADRRAGKRNLVVRLGRKRASRAYVAIGVLTAVLLAILPLFGLGWGVLWGLAFTVFAVPAAAILWKHHETPARIVPAQALTLAAFVALALGMGIGSWIG